MARMKTTGGKVTVKAQRHDGADEALIKLIHMAMPWLAWLGLTAFGAALRLGLYLGARGQEFAWIGVQVWAGLLTLGVALVIALFDARLRSHRASWEGRWIGPVTAAFAGLVTCLWLAAGFSLPLALAYLFGGVIACICWDVWITVGDHRDMAQTFNSKAEAAGVAGAKMFEVSRRPAGIIPDEDDAPAAPRRARGRERGRRPRDEVVEVGLVLPSDPAMTMDEVGDRLGHIEVATNARPGSLALTTDPDEAGFAMARSTPPDLLTRAPIPWPGPYAPGADMSVPFRLSVLQTGEPFLFRRLPLTHIRVMGMTGSAKTMGFAWNMLAEGITRTDYAAFVVDTAKREQFMGPLRPALHALVLDEDAVHLFFARMHRARFDRMDYLGRNRHTEWFPGCGLSFMDCWLEEAGEVLKLLGVTQADRRDGKFMLEDHVGDVNTGRSAGMSWTESYQKAVKEQSRSTVGTSQMGRVCFALAGKEDLRFGLTDRQLERGCRPTLFARPDGKAMAFFDTETVPEDEAVTPMRFFNWGPGSSRIAAYASEYQARDRPLDDVTGEAMTWTPPVSSSSAFPQASPRPSGHGPRAYENSGLSPKKRSMLEAEEKTREVLAGWLGDGKGTCAVDDLTKMAGHIGKTRTWFYSTLRKFEGYGWLEDASDGTTRRWTILPAITGQLQDSGLHAVDDLEANEGDDAA